MEEHGIECFAFTLLYLVYIEDSDSDSDSFGWALTHSIEEGRVCLYLFIYLVDGMLPPIIIIISIDCGVQINARTCVCVSVT